MSDLTGAGKDKLLEKMSEFLARDMVKITAVLPYEEAQWVDKLHQQGQVINEEYKQGEIEIEAKISKKLASKLEDYILKSEPLF